MNCGTTRQQRIITAVILALGVLACIWMLTASAGCATVRLERRLAPEVRAWYGIHEILMETVVPEDISGAKGMTERTYFLRLPEALQTRYRAMFWQVRDFDTRAVFESRRTYVNRALVNYKHSPMATLIILCGLPEDIELYSPGGYFIGSAGILDNKGYSNTVAIWSYYYKSYRVRYGFESTGETWRPCPISAVMVNEQAKFERYWRWLMGPSWNGWDAWREIIGKRVGQ